MTTVAAVDEGTPVVGGRCHNVVKIDDRIWTRGDLFHVLDRRGVPRPVKFMYHNTANNSTTCYSLQRFRMPGRETTVPAGFIVMVPSQAAISMTPTEIRVRQLYGDLLDAGLDAEAETLIGVFDEGGGAEELHEAERVARAALGAREAALEDEDT